MAKTPKGTKKGPRATNYVREVQPPSKRKGTKPQLSPVKFRIPGASPTRVHRVKKKDEPQITLWDGWETDHWNRALIEWLKKKKIV